MDGSSIGSSSSAPVTAQIAVENKRRDQEAAVAETLITPPAPRVEGQSGQKLNLAA